MQIPRFTAPPHFYNELKARVNEYFEETKQAPTGNWRLFSKSLVIISLHVLFYSILVFFTPPGWYALIFCVLLGFSSAAIGFNIMHDGSHGSFSENKALNRVAAFSLNVLGGNDYMWNVKHCVVHHSFTNVAGVDDDIEVAFMRMCESQPLRPWHRFQAIYFVVLYSLLYLFWLFVFDFKKYFVGKVGMMPIPKMKLSQHVGFWASKIGCYFFLVALPIYMVGMVKFLIGFTFFVLVTGFIVSLVFQLAHTVEHTSFPLPNEAGKFENEWAIHQLQTTANFATRNPIVTWFCGGLNFQIEHHLFPKISHIHYPKISNIVRQMCREHGVDYIEYPRVTSAIRSHLRLLWRMGQPSVA